MKNASILNYTIIAGLVYLAWISYKRKRTRALWATYIFAVCILVGITVGVLGLAQDLNLFEFENGAASRLDVFLSFGRGLVSGFILTLIFSGQLIGKP